MTELVSNVLEEDFAGSSALFDASRAKTSLSSFGSLDFGDLMAVAELSASFEGKEVSSLLSLLSPPPPPDPSFSSYPSSSGLEALLRASGVVMGGEELEFDQDVHPKKANKRRKNSNHNRPSSYAAASIGAKEGENEERCDLNRGRKGNEVFISNSLPFPSHSASTTSSNSSDTSSQSSNEEDRREEDEGEDEEGGEDGRGQEDSNRSMSRQRSNSSHPLSEGVNKYHPHHPEKVVQLAEPVRLHQFLSLLQQSPNTLQSVSQFCSKYLSQKINSAELFLKLEEAFGNDQKLIDCFLLLPVSASRSMESNSQCELNSLLEKYKSVQEMVCKRNQPPKLKPLPSNKRKNGEALPQESSEISVLKLQQSIASNPSNGPSLAARLHHPKIPRAPSNDYYLQNQPPSSSSSSTFTYPPLPPPPITASSVRTGYRANVFPQRSSEPSSSSSSDSVRVFLSRVKATLTSSSYDTFLETMLELRHAFRASHVHMALAKLESIRAMLPRSRQELHRALDTFFPLQIAQNMDRHQQFIRHAQLTRWRQSVRPEASSSSSSSAPPPVSSSSSTNDVQPTAEVDLTRTQEMEPSLTTGQYSEPAVVDLVSDNEEEDEGKEDAANSIFVVRTDDGKDESRDSGESTMVDEEEEQNLTEVTEEEEVFKGVEGGINTEEKEEEGMKGIEEVINMEEIGDGNREKEVTLEDEENKKTRGKAEEHNDGDVEPGRSRVLRSKGY